MPAGVSLSQSRRNPSARCTWSPNVCTSQLITLASHASADFDLTVTATSHDDHQTTTSAAQQIHVAVAPEAPVLTVADASGNEDTAISLAGKISATVDGGETITYTISGIPAGARSEEHTSELQSHSELVCRLL